MYFLLGYQTGKLVEQSEREERLNDGFNENREDCNSQKVIELPFSIAIASS